MDDPRYSPEDAEIKKALESANIGRQYVRTRIGELGKVGKDLRNHFSDPDTTLIRVLDGKCVIIQSKDYKSHDVMMAYLRGYVISGINAVHGTPDQFSLDYRFEDGTHLTDGKVVWGVSSMFNDGYPEKPFLPQNQYKIESAFRYAMDDDKPLVFSGIGKFSESHWWSDDFKERVLTKAEVFTT